MAKTNKIIETKCDKCKFSHLFSFKGFQKYCVLNRARIYNPNLCENCLDYKNKNIEFPIQVNEIEMKELEQYFMSDAGSLVRIRPCGEEYEGKTYLGLHLGNQPWAPCYSYNEETKKLSFSVCTNPAIYVFELKKVIFGAQSWWSVIENEDELRDITNEDIDNVWYVQMLKGMLSKKD